MPKCTIVQLLPCTAKKGRKKRHAAQSMLSFTSTFGRALYHFSDEGYSSYNMKDLVVKKCFNLRYKYFLTFTRANSSIFLTSGTSIF